MSKLKKALLNNLFIIVALFTILIISSPFILACGHSNLYGIRLSEQTCETDANIKVVCMDCGMHIDNITHEALGHDFGEYEIVVEPSMYKDGLEVRYCKNCDEKEERIYKCKHETITTHVPKTSTCTVNGVVISSCKDCHTPITELVLDLLEHSYGDWSITRYATPLNNGEKVRYCTSCDTKDTTSYSMSMAGSNSIYIPGTSINHIVAISSFTQAAVDSYYIVYTESTWRTGSNDPFVLGHNYWPLGALYQTDVGQYIYLSINGRIETYKVMVSEYAKEINNEIIGQWTGVSMWRNYGVKTLHLYTCYGGGKGRWLVLAKKVG